MRWGLVIYWLSLLLGSAAPTCAHAPADTLRLAAVNSGPWVPYLSYCLDPCAQPSDGPRAAGL
ncbi:MAG: hypothetical protein ACRYG7_47860 [Janthinobacterium lividum]